jgi:hypothetical protein
VLVAFLYVGTSELAIPLKKKFVIDSGGCHLKISGSIALAFAVRSMQVTSSAN